MKFELKESPYKFATFWLSKSESNDAEFMAKLKPEFKFWKAKGYQPVVYHSGSGSLEDSVYGLIKHNFEVMAKAQVVSGEKLP